jgi:hypothetical protein
VEFEIIFSKQDSVAVTKETTLDALIVDECTVGAAEIHELMSLCHCDNFSVPPGHMLVRNDQVDITLPADDRLRRRQDEHLIPAIRSLP